MSLKYVHVIRGKQAQNYLFGSIRRIIVINKWFTNRSNSYGGFNNQYLCVYRVDVIRSYVYPQPKWSEYVPFRYEII